MYNPIVGRWMEEDPIDFKAGDRNLSRYAGNNATNETDPSGFIATVATTNPFARVAEDEWVRWVLQGMQRLNLREVGSLLVERMRESIDDLFGTLTPGYRPGKEKPFQYSSYKLLAEAADQWFQLRLDAIDAQRLIERSFRQFGFSFEAWIDSRIARLGDRNFRVRRGAKQELWRAIPFLPALEQRVKIAMGNNDPEIRKAASELYDHAVEYNRDYLLYWLSRAVFTLPEDRMNSVITFFSDNQEYVPDPFRRPFRTLRALMNQKKLLKPKDL